MTVDEARQTLVAIRNSVALHYDSKGKLAIELGIEALKAYKILRSPGSPHYPHILPGETE